MADAFDVICNECNRPMPAHAVRCPSCSALATPARGAPGRPTSVDDIWANADAAGLRAQTVGFAPPPKPVYYGEVGIGRDPHVVPSAYGGFWIRVVATLIDSALLIGLYFLLRSAVSSPALPGLVALVLALFYRPVMESSASQGTFGKIVCGLTVTDLSGRRISFGRAFLREIGRFVEVFTLGIGYLLAVFNERKRTLHDYIAGTLVLKRGMY